MRAAAGSLRGADAEAGEGSQTGGPITKDSLGIPEISLPEFKDLCDFFWVTILAILVTNKKFGVTFCQPIIYRTACPFFLSFFLGGGNSI